MMFCKHVTRLRFHHRGLQQIAFDAGIEQLGASPFLRFTRRDLLGRYNLADLTLGIIDVAGDNRARGTYDDAGRFQIQLNPMGAEVALGRCMSIRIEIKRIVRTCLHARFASDTAAAIEIDYAIVAAEKSSGRAYLNTWGIITMVATHHAEMAAGLRKGPLFDVFDPGAENANWYIVLFFASNRARMTSDTAVMIDDKPVPQVDSSPTNLDQTSVVCRK
jgi:hypothetical protein